MSAKLVNEESEKREEEPCIERALKRKTMATDAPARSMEGSCHASGYKVYDWLVTGVVAPPVGGRGRRAADLPLWLHSRACWFPKVFNGRLRARPLEQ